VFSRSSKRPANIQQTSSSIITYGSKRPANFQQTSSTCPALHLLKVCWTFAGTCKHPIRRRVFNTSRKERKNLFKEYQRK